MIPETDGDINIRVLLFKQVHGCGCIKPKQFWRSREYLR